MKHNEDADTGNKNGESWKLINKIPSHNTSKKGLLKVTLEKKESKVVCSFPKLAM